MTENPMDFLPLWMLLSAAFGFLAGEAFGDSTRHRKCLQQVNDDLRETLKKGNVDQQSFIQELKRQRGEINDIHKHVVAVRKGLEKTAP